MRTTFSVSTKRPATWQIIWKNKARTKGKIIRRDGKVEGRIFRGDAALARRARIKEK